MAAYTRFMCVKLILRLAFEYKTYLHIFSMIHFENKYLITATHILSQQNIVTSSILNLSYYLYTTDISILLWKSTFDLNIFMKENLLLPIIRELGS